MKLYRGPWIWSNEPFGCWKTPEGSIGSIDLRTLAGVGDGLFMTDANLPSPYQLLTNERNQMASIAHDLLTTDPDPEGITAHKPLLPNGDKYEIFLGDTKLEEKLVRSGKMWDASCRVIQADIEKIHAQNPMLARKCLGFLERQHGDYSKFIPKRLAGLKSAKPETTYSDDFNRANTNTVVGWYEYEGTATGWRIESNKLAQTTSGPAPVTERFCRYESDFSSSDHYSQAAIIQISYNNGCAVRMSTSALTAYYGAIGGAHWSVDGYVMIGKIISSAATSLYSVARGITAGTVKLQASGSTIGIYNNSTLLQEVTDTAITGNTRAGVYGYSNTHFDDWTGSDLAAPASTISSSTLGLMGIIQ